MATIDGLNTYVLSVRGNFDDCQTGVKRLFADEQLKSELAARGVALSSANSINWGRLCPQIVYYFYAYIMLRERAQIAEGEAINFCVPTGNFGNILAGFYAQAMGLPVERFICASNKNKILTDFFETGVYDRNREFFRTMSPSMDILISSNLERFLFEMTGHDDGKINAWYSSLAETGQFRVDETTKAAMDEVILAGWVDEPRALRSIRDVYESFHYVIDTHTAVGVAVSDGIDHGGRHTVIDSTASPYKFSGDVLRGLCGEAVEDEFESIVRLHELSGIPIHRAVDGLREKPVRHGRILDVGQMKEALLDVLEEVTPSTP
jgi:threonine synthase